MKNRPVFLALSGALALFGALLLPQPSSGQAAAAVDPVLAQMITEIGVQQATVFENQIRIDEKLAIVAEDIRIARVYVGRGGGKAK